MVVGTCQARNSNITLCMDECADDPLHPVIVHCDKAKMAQAFRNLLSNALKFTPAGGTVEVRVHVVDNSTVQSSPRLSPQTPQPFVRIDVQDSGHGISAENQTKLFSSIVQFNPGTLQNGGGSGLGLWSE